MSKQTIKKIFRGHSRCCNAPNYSPSTFLLVVISVWWKYTQLDRKFLKDFSRKSLSEDICKHVLGRHVIKFDFLAFNLLAYKMILDVDILGSRIRYWVVCKCDVS